MEAPKRDAPFWAKMGENNKKSPKKGRPSWAKMGENNKKNRPKKGVPSGRKIKNCAQFFILCFHSI